MRRRLVILRRKRLNALPTNAVAALAGVSIGSLYQYFPGKTVILAELMDGGTNLI
ncbi:MAG: helix-turn-helix domain-containing protein [Acidithiobacillus sp.]